jgi:MFS family permease
LSRKTNNKCGEIAVLDEMTATASPAAIETNAPTAAPELRAAWRLATPLCGRLVDIFGTRRVALAGCILLPLGFSLASLVGGRLWEWYGFALLIAFLAPLLAGAAFDASSNYQGFLAALIPPDATHDGQA